MYHTTDTLANPFQVAARVDCGFKASLTECFPQINHISHNLEMRNRTSVDIVDCPIGGRPVVMTEASKLFGEFESFVQP